MAHLCDSLYATPAVKGSNSENIVDNGAFAYHKLWLHDLEKKLYLWSKGLNPR